MNEYYKAIDMICEVYKFHKAGGALHVVLDDCNFCNSSIMVCIDSLEREFFDEKSIYTPAQLALQYGLANFLLNMSEDEVNAVVSTAQVKLESMS